MLMTATINANTPIIPDVYAYSFSLSFISANSLLVIVKKLPSSANNNAKRIQSKTIIHADASVAQFSYIFSPPTIRNNSAKKRSPAPIVPMITDTKRPKKLSAKLLFLSSSANLRGIKTSFKNVSRVSRFVRFCFGTGEHPSVLGCFSCSIRFKA